MELDKLAKRYVGNRAHEYDNERTYGQKWLKEQEIMEEILANIEKGSSILDIPVGTGRFIEFYKKFSLNPTGMDVSDDMLANAKEKAAHHNYHINLKKSDICKIDSADCSFDATLCIRLLNWLEFNSVKLAVKELTRTSNKYVIFGVRHYVPLNKLNLKTVRGFLCFFYQIKRKIIKIIKPDGLIYHQKAQIDSLFTIANLDIIKKYCVEERTDGTDYYFYLLKKK